MYKHDHESKDEYELRVTNRVDRTFNTQIDLDIFAAIINEVRNNFAHEGDYYSFHFADGEGAILNSLIIAENKAEWQLLRTGNTNDLKRIYEIQLSYEMFKSIWIFSIC